MANSGAPTSVRNQDQRKGQQNLSLAMMSIVVAGFAFLMSLPGLFTLPPLDRDEARFAQATAQMLETGDFISIRFQEAERNKKPAGIHWLQAASVAAFSDVQAREIWAYRIPSVIGAILAALFTALAGARLFSPVIGLTAGLLMAAAPGLAGEATIAKTDAFLLASICACQLLVIRLFADMMDGKRISVVPPILFWSCFAISILIKGPIGPMVTGFTLAGLFLRYRQLPWFRSFRPFLGAVIVIGLLAPWGIGIWNATEGRFFAEALGGDMAGKISTAQESHSGPPGYHLIGLPLLFWPAAALIIPGLIQAWKTKRSWPSFLLLAWLAPAWIVFELTATKLPHYTLPLYPTLAILAARAISTGVAQRRPRVRLTGALLYALTGLVAAGLVIALPIIYGEGSLKPLCFGIGGAIAVGSVLIAFTHYRGAARLGAFSGIALSATLAVVLLQLVLPSLHKLTVSRQLDDMVDAADLHAIHDNAAPTIIAGYYEPSAVFLLGTKTEFARGAGAATKAVELMRSAAIIVEEREQPAFEAALQKNNIVLKKVGVVEGINYSNGKNVRLTVYKGNDSP